MKLLLRDLLAEGENRLKEAGILSWRNDAYCLLNKHFPATRAEILVSPAREIGEQALEAYRADLAARAARTPLQHLLGSWEFMGLSFAVNPQVLIPRPETEWLAETVIRRYNDPEKPLAVLDLCAGSGCIGIAIKHYLPHAEVTLLDISRLALDVAKENAAALGAEVRFENWDLLQGVPFFLEKKRYDVIVSNPPYVKTGDLVALEPEVRAEPRLALDGGDDGLLYYRAIARDWCALLREDGELLVEAGEDTCEEVQKIFARTLRESTLHRDLAGLPRYVTAKK